MTVDPAGCASDFVTRRFVISGRVQGVFFRQSTRREAEHLNVKGVARNLADGSVEVIAQGAPAAVERLHQWLHQGPPHAKVTGVSESDCGQETEYAATARLNFRFPGFTTE